MHINSLHGTVIAFLLLCSYSWAAAFPRASIYDNRMQHVNYNANNTTVLMTRLGYLSTLIFDHNENVMSTRVGFEAGWDVSFEANRVYVRVRPVTQKQTTLDGEEVQKVFEPTLKEWKTNLFVTTTQRFYSIELNALENDDVKQNPAFVVNYRYPQEIKAKAQKEENARLKEGQAQQEKLIINQKLVKGQFPRNWHYFMRVEDNSRKITPDFAYDDGQFTYLGFSPLKTFPSLFLYHNGKEQMANFSVEQKGNYKVMVIHHLSETFVLRSGDQVVGVINKGFGQVNVDYSNTRSTSVERVEVKP